jgi:hypothetical protein
MYLFLDINTLPIYLVPKIIHYFGKYTNAPQNHMCKILPSLVYKDWLAEHLVLSEEDGRD